MVNASHFRQRKACYWAWFAITVCTFSLHIQAVVDQLLQRPASEAKIVVASAANSSSFVPELTAQYAVAATSESMSHSSSLAKQPFATVQNESPQPRLSVQPGSALTGDNLSGTNGAGAESKRTGPAMFGLVRSPFYGLLGDPFQFWDDGATRAGGHLMRSGSLEC